MKKYVNKLFAGILLVLIAGFVIKGIESWAIPESLKESRNEKVHALRFHAEDVQAVVFYPKDVEQEFVSSMAQMIREDLSHLSLSENIKVDYRRYEQGGYLFLCFDAVDEHGKLLKAYSGICSTQTHEVIELDELVQDSFYEFVSTEIRYQVKESEILGDLAYTLEFYQKTDAEAMKQMQFYLEEDTAFIYVPCELNGTSYFLNCELKMDQISSYFEEDEVMYAASNLVHPVRHYVDADRPMVALTFDDGPVRNHTLLALELLNAYDAKGTFFMLGFRMERNPDVVLEVINDGHEVGSHTYNHPYLTKKKTDLSYQYTRNQEILSEITEGQAEIKLLRPPYGAFNQQVKNTSPYPLVMWSLDTLDWKTLDAQATYECIMENVQDGDIILLHDLHESSVESLRSVVPALIESGYQIVTVSEMMEARGIEMKQGVSYSKARKTIDASE